MTPNFKIQVAWWAEHIFKSKLNSLGITPESIKEQFIVKHGFSFKIYEINSDDFHLLQLSTDEKSLVKNYKFNYKFFVRRKNGTF